MQEPTSFQEIESRPWAILGDMLRLAWARGDWRVFIGLARLLQRWEGGPC